MSLDTSSPQRSVAAVLAFAALIVCVAMGIRHTFGLFLTPMSMEHQWNREVFSFALALQNLMWGATQPFAGFLADRLRRAPRAVGRQRHVCIGPCLAWPTPAPARGLAASAGLLIGAAQSGCTYSVVFAALGALVPESRRAWSMGVVAAAGSFGQFLMIPVASQLIGGMGWFGTLLIFSAAALLIMPLGSALTRGLAAMAATRGQTGGEALREAMREKGYLLLNVGYFVCGFQVVFIGVHFPTYLLDKGLGPEVGMTSLALIGLFNVFGSYSAGQLGNRYPKRHLLAAIYFARSVAISLFLWLPLTPLTAYVFAATMGLLWLSTVPLTNAIVAQVFGVRFLGMLSGLVFFSHQVGSFLGVWLGGKLFDATGSYNTIWGICILLGLVAALCHFPIDERKLDARQPAPA
jgi:predicted MFS family arabinose efflux permease